MAEMTQEMYGATGRVGNKTYYRSNGKTIAREVVTPKNPKTHSLTPPEGDGGGSLTGKMHQAALDDGALQKDGAYFLFFLQL